MRFTNNLLFTVMIKTFFSLKTKYINCKLNFLLDLYEQIWYYSDYIHN